MTAHYADRAGELATLARRFYERGWMPGTAGNISVRGEDGALITASGFAKGEITAADVVSVRVADSRPLDGHGARPSAETAIHTALYRATGCAAIVHVHSPHATAASVRFGRFERLTTVPFRHYELLKGLALVDPANANVPVFPNWDDVTRIGSDIERYITTQISTPPVLLIGGHGATAWGDSLGQARDRLECLEALCLLVTLTGKPAAWATQLREPQTLEEEGTR